MTKWESEKYNSWGMPVEGVRGHVATDGSLLRKAGKWGACGCAVVQLDFDEKMVSPPFASDVRFSGGRIRDPAHHKEGGADGLLMLS